MPSGYEPPADNPGMPAATPTAIANTAFRADLPPELQAKVAASIEVLRAAAAAHGRVVYASSLGAEAVVLTDLILTEVPGIDVATIDTGRLPEETLSLLERVERRYQRRIRVYTPQAAEVEAWVAEHGINAFFQSLELRQQCCELRKFRPFERALAGYSAWVTGVRHAQSATRAGNEAFERDARNGLMKVSPLLAWTSDEVWAYIRAGKLPYNALHDKGYPSIGCAPCSRAIEPGQDERAGRWWWEHPDSRECGLQPRTRS
jgi:phosphoadenosine phosphosulfate reductase